MKLNFRKAGNDYQASQIVDADFNVHLEVKDDNGRIGAPQVTILISTVEDGKAAVKYRGACTGEVFDQDFQALVYPKYVTIVSSDEVIDGELTIMQ